MLGFAPLATTPLGTSSHNEAFTLVAQSGTYAISTQGVGKLITDVYPSGSYTLNGRAISLGVGYANMTFDTGTFTLSGQSLVFSIGQGIVFDTGTYTITTNDADLVPRFGVVAESLGYTLSGQNIGFSVLFKAPSGTYTLTGHDAFKGVGEGFENGSFTMTGRDAEFSIAMTAKIETGLAATLTGSDIQFRGFFSPYVPPEIWTEVA